MPQICPECKEPYGAKRTGKKTTIPEDATAHHRSQKLAGGGSVGVWYIHE